MPHLLLVIIGLSVMMAMAVPGSGQSVSPSFEGWFRNPDGTFSLSFGYFNRNDEVLDIPVGQNNRIEPGPEDQGQPTHFLPRRQTGVFTVVVPKDFGNRKLTWTLVANGETVSIPGHLRPEWEIDALKEQTSGNTPPVVRFAPAGQPRQGPGGATTALNAKAPGPVILIVWATDDGIKKRPQDDALLGVAWSKYRGPGKVTFTNPTPAIDSAGKATTTATFSEPGRYVLRVLVWDDAGPQGAIMAGGFQCCWTNGYVKIMVNPATKRSR